MYIDLTSICIIYKKFLWSVFFYMAMKIIRVSDNIHSKLSSLGLKSETFSDIIERLIIFYEEENFNDFDDDTAAYYNERIRLFDLENYEGMQEVDLDAIRSRE